MPWILIFLTLPILAVFTSQSLVDLSDILLTLSALFIAFKQKELKTFFTNFKPSLFWLLWLAVVVVGLLINVGFSNANAWNEFLEFRWILTLLAVIYLAHHYRDQVDKLIKPWSWLLLILNVIAAILFLQDPHWRVQGILKQTMSFSHNIGPLFCVFLIYLLGNWKTLSGKDKALTFAVTASSAALTVFTFTRGVWVGVFIGVASALFIWNRKVFLGFLAAFLVFGTGLVLTNKRISDRVFNKTTNETQSNDERRALWRGNWRIIEDYPLFGVGFQQNKYHLRKYYDEFGLPPGQRESHAHNQYLQVWAGTGTLGFICFLSFLILILKRTYDGYSRLSQPGQKFWQLGLFAGLVSFMVGALTESNFNIAKNRLLFLVLAGLAVSAALHKHRIKKST